MSCRQCLFLVIASMLLSTLPGCCCCVRGFRGPMPQPQPQPQPFPQDGIVVGPKDKLDGIKVDDRKPEDKKVDGIKLLDKLDKDALNKLIDKLNKKDKKDGPPPPVDLEDVSTGGPLVADPMRKPLARVTDAKGSVLVPREEPGVIQNDPFRFPWTPSPVVAVLSEGDKKGGGQAWQVWDMQAMKQLGAVDKPGGTIYVSPDGLYLGIEVYKPGTVHVAGVQVYNVADGKPLKLLPTRFAVDSTIGTTDFAGPGQMYSLQASGTNAALVKLWDVKTGEQLSSFNVTAWVDRRTVGQSPGGRYLATWDTFKRILHIYEFATGKEVRTIQLKLPFVQFSSCQGIAFSDDGKELAIWLEMGGTSSRIRVYDVVTGKRTFDHDLGQSLANKTQFAMFHKMPFLWLPDASGWFVYGQFMIDKKRGNVFWTMPPQDPKIPWPRRFVDNDHIVTVMGKAPQRRLEIVTLPREEIEAARKK